MNTLVKRLSAALPLCIILLFFLLFTSIPLWDSDFFWHLKTGEYIAQHKEIPEEDPFSYTTPDGETLRKNFILGQYWLSQLIFYFIWKQAGIGGIIIFRALLLSSILLIMYLLMRRKVDPLLLSVFIFLSGSVFIYFTGERPQLFSFLGAALLIFIVERYKETKGKILYALPVVTLIWANLHGGVILGDALLLIYILSEGVKLLFKLNPLEKKEYLRLLFFCAVSVAISTANPNTYHLFTAFYKFSEKSITLQMSSEFLSPLTIALQYKKIYWEYFLIIVLIIFIIPLTMFTRGRKVDLSAVAVITFLSVISLVSARYMIFPCIVFPLLAADVNHLIQNRFHRIKVLAGIGILIFMCYTLWGKGVFSFRIHETYPDRAVEFIKKTMPAGNLFNYFDWGGYLMVMLPEYKVFIDGRGLDEGVRIKYTLLLTGSTMRYADKYEWEHIAGNYNINIVLLPWYHLTIGGKLRLVEILLNNPGWKLSYSDEKSVVFLRIRRK